MPEYQPRGPEQAAEPRWPSVLCSLMQRKQHLPPRAAVRVRNKPHSIPESSRGYPILAGAAVGHWGFKGLSLARARRQRSLRAMPKSLSCISGMLESCLSISRGTDIIRFRLQKIPLPAGWGRMGEQERPGTKHANILPTPVILPLPDDAIREADAILSVGSYQKEKRNCDLISKHRNSCIRRRQ